MRMNAAEVAELIVQRWRCGHTIEAIQMQLVCLGCAIDKARILAAVKIYCNNMTENAYPVAGRLDEPQ